MAKCVMQVCWKKFCTYFDVEMRAVPVTEDCLVMDPKKVPHTYLLYTLWLPHTFCIPQLDG